VSRRGRARGQAPWNTIPCSAAAAEREAKAELLALTGLQPFLVSSIAAPPPRRLRWLPPPSQEMVAPPPGRPQTPSQAMAAPPPHRLQPPSHTMGAPSSASSPARTSSTLLPPSPTPLLPFQRGSAVRLRPPRARRSTMVRSSSLNCKETSSVSVQLNSAPKIAAAQ
jgi:hypothetical protein